MYDLDFEEIGVTTWTLMRQTWIATNKAAELKLSKVGLTPEKASVLWACIGYPGTLTPAEIARLVFRENQTIAGLLNRMEKEGLVTRVPKRKGHPFTEVKITPKGEKIAGPGIEIYKNMIRGLMATVPVEDQKELQRIFRAMRQKLLDDMHMELDRVPPQFATDKPISINNKKQ